MGVGFRSGTGGGLIIPQVLFIMVGVLIVNQGGPMLPSDLISNIGEVTLVGTWVGWVISDKLFHLRHPFFFSHFSSFLSRKKKRKNISSALVVIPDILIFSPSNGPLTNRNPS